jgi:hypothetical protein
VGRQWTWLLRLTVISSQYWPCCLGLFFVQETRWWSFSTQYSGGGLLRGHMFSRVVVHLLLPLSGSEVFGGRGGGWHECQCHGGCCWSTHSPGPRLSGHHGGSSIPARAITEHHMISCQQMKMEQLWNSKTMVEGNCVSGKKIKFKRQKGTSLQKLTGLNYFSLDT